MLKDSLFGELMKNSDYSDYYEFKNFEDDVEKTRVITMVSDIENLVLHDAVQKMKKVLYSIGDSWTYGWELENPQTECYPYLLSQKLGCDLINEGLPGSNDWMFRKASNG